MRKSKNYLLFNFSIQIILKNLVLFPFCKYKNVCPTFGLQEQEFTGEIKCFLHINKNNPLLIGHSGDISGRIFRKP